MRSTLPAAVLGLLLGAQAAGAQGPATGTPPPFTETIEVREVEVFFDASPLPRFESIGKKGIEDFAVFEAGAAHDLLEMTTTTSADWVHVLWFDDALASREAQASAAMALARRAETLTAGGRAEIVVADPMPHVLTATSMPDLLARALNELAGRRLEAAAKLDLASSGHAAAASVSERSRQLDRMVVDIVSRGGGGPHALWLAVDGWPLSPQELERWSRAKPGEPADVPERRTLIEASRVLAGYGWVTFPVAIRPVRAEDATKDSERRVEVQSGGTGDERTSVPMFTVSGQEPTSGSAEAQVSALTDFSLAPLSELARATSGALLGNEERLRSELSDVVSRRRATYRGPRPEPGALLPVEIRWRGGDGRALPAARYLRSSTPVEVTAARLRALLAGDAAPPHPGIGAGNGAGEYCFRSEADELPVRLSAARKRSDGGVELEIGEMKILKKEGGRRCATLPAGFSADPAGVAWVAENLDDESWAGGTR